MADLVRQSPTETMAQRYQDGLMEFDQALAYFREQDEIKRRELREQSPPLEVSSSDDHFSAEVPAEIPVEIPTNTTEPEIEPIKSSRTWLAVLIILTLLIGGGVYGFQEWQKRQHETKQIQWANWEKEAVDHISKRRWQEALTLYQQIEANNPSSEVAAIGRRSIEAGMREEQEQYLGYWTGEAISAFDANNWKDAEAAIAKVYEVQPKHPEMLALEKKLSLLKSSEERKRLTAEIKKSLEVDDWELAMMNADRLLAFDPLSTEVLALKQRAIDGLELQKSNTQEALILVARIQNLDKGKYDKELLELATTAKRLAPHDKDVLICYEKIASYVRTLRVPQDFPDLQKALIEAKSNDRVVIEKGTYQGPFSVNVPLVIEASGGRAILECDAAKGPALSLGAAASGSRVQGLQIQHTSFNTGAERFSAAYVEEAQVQFIDCEFRHASGHGLIALRGADVAVDDCSFLENGWNGVAAQHEKTKITLRDSLCRGNFHHGIEVWDQATAIIEHCRSEANSQTGAHIDSTAILSMKGNEFTANREYGVVLRQTGVGDVSKNQMRNNILGGAVVTIKAAQSLLRENIIELNDGPALMLGKGLQEADYLKNQLKAKPNQKAILTQVPME